MTAEERKRGFEKCQLFAFGRRLRLSAEAIDFVSINTQSLAIKRIGVAVALEGVTKESPRLANCLVEASRAAAWIVTWPKSLLQLGAPHWTALHCEVGDKFCSSLPTRLPLLAAGEFERP
jgi:hypothetical protein